MKGRVEIDDRDSRVRALVGPILERLERIERKSDATRDELRDLVDRYKPAAKAAGLKGMKYSVIVALAVVNPKVALARLLTHLENAEDNGPLIENKEGKSTNTTDDDNDNAFDDDA